MSVFTVILAAAAAVTPPSLELPIPPEFQGNNTTVTQFVSLEEVETYCGKPEPPKVRLGCARVGKPVMWVINPCHWKESETIGTYAHYICHELAHTNGWTHP